MKLLALLFIIGILIAGILETCFLKAARKKIKAVIHVNGTRGKSTVARLIDAGLRADGKHKIYTKTTGSVAAVIDVDGVEKRILRRGKANISEQIRQLIKASKQGADIVVMECMAIRPDLQKVCEEKILHSDITVVSNIRNDHIPEMGNSLAEIAIAFTYTFPENGEVYTSRHAFEPIFAAAAARRHSGIHVIDGEALENLPGISAWPVFLRQNLALALAVCAQFGVEKSRAWEAMQHYLPDPFAFRCYSLRGNIIFANALSANDPFSTSLIVNWLDDQEDFRNRKRIIIVNGRKDRSLRTSQMLEWAFRQTAAEIWLLAPFVYRGEHASKIRVQTSRVRDLPFHQLRGGECLLAVGNIAGEGYALMDWVRERLTANAE